LADTTCFNGLTFSVGNNNIKPEHIRFKLTPELYKDENGIISKIHIQDNTINIPSEKTRLFYIRSSFTNLPTTLEILLCNENGVPLVFITEGKQRNLILQIPRSEGEIWNIADVDAQYT
jgi:hypothetical protein